MSTDLHTLSGAFALNALSAQEAEQFRRHLDECQACRQEVRELQQAAARMGADEAVAPPPYLKARVLAAADRTPQQPPRPGGGGTVVEVPPHRWGRRLLLAAAAVVLVVAGGIGIGQLGGSEEQLAAGVVRVFEAEDAHTAEMPVEAAGREGRIRVAASPELNQMAVDSDELPPLDDEHVYKLWAFQGEQMQLVGVLEREKGAFMGMPTPDTEVVITVEPVDGPDRPTTEPIMRVNPSEI